MNYLNISLKRLTISVVSALFLCLLITFAFQQRVSAAVDTCTWTGAVNGNWSDGGNWTGCDNGGVPETGDTVYFGFPASNKTTNNDLSIILGTVGIYDTGFTFNGNDMEVSGSIFILQSATFNSIVKFTASSGAAGMQIDSPAPSTFANPVVLNHSGTANFTIHTSLVGANSPTFTGSTPNFFFQGNSGTGTINTSSSASDFVVSGNVFIKTTTVLCNNNNCLGDSSNILQSPTLDGELGNFQINDGVNVPNDYIIGNNTAAGEAHLSVPDNATATLSGDLTLQDVGTFTAATVKVGSNATLNLAGSFTNTVDASAPTDTTFVGQGPGSVVNITGNLSYDSSNGAGIIFDNITANLSGPSAVISNGLPFTISNGARLNINANYGTQDVVGTNATLGGSGTINDVTLDSASTLAAGNSPGQLTITGNLNLGGGSFDVELNGTTVGTEYDQTIVTGTADITGSTLNVSLGFTPATGDTFTILTSSGLTGTFSGLADGDTFTSGGVVFRINYTGGNVILTVLDSSSSTVGSSTPTAGAPDTGLAEKNMIFSALAIILGSGMLLNQTKLSSLVRRKA